VFDIIKTSRLKILKKKNGNFFNTSWIFMLNPMKRVMVEFMILSVKMNLDVTQILKLQQISTFWAILIFLFYLSWIPCVLKVSIFARLCSWEHHTTMFITKS